MSEIEHLRQCFISFVSFLSVTLLFSLTKFFRHYWWFLRALNAVRFSPSVCHLRCVYSSVILRKWLCVYPGQSHLLWAFISVKQGCPLTALARSRGRQSPHSSLRLRFSGSPGRDTPPPRPQEDPILTCLHRFPCTAASLLSQTLPLF